MEESGHVKESEREGEVQRSVFKRVVERKRNVSSGLQAAGWLPCSNLVAVGEQSQHQYTKAR